MQKKEHDILHLKSRSCIGTDTIVWWDANGNTDVNKQTKTCTDWIPVKNITQYHKNEWQHKHEPCNSSVSEWMLIVNGLLAKKIESVP